MSSSEASSPELPSYDDLLRRLCESTEPAEQLGDGVMAALGGLLASNTVLVHAVDASGDLHLVGSRGASEEIVAQVATLAPDRAELTARAAATRSHESVDAAGAASRADGEILKSAGAERLQAIPLLVRGTLWGVLTFAAGAAGPAGRHLDAVAAALALALAATGSPRGDLVHRMVRVTSEFTDYWARRPYSFARVETALTPSPHELRGFFALVAERARDLVDAEMAAVGLGTSPDRPFDPWVVVGVPADVERAIGRSPRPVGTLGAVAVSGETIRVRDVHQHASFVGLPPHHPEVRSFLAVPLHVGGERFGNLYLANKRGADGFDRLDQSVVEILATVTLVLTTLESDRTRMRQILDAAYDGILFVDAKTGFVFANAVFECLIDRELVPERGVAQELGAVLSPDGTPLTLEDMPSSRALAGEPAVDRELLMLRRDGRRIPMSAKAAPIRGPGSQIVGAVVTYRDMSAHKELDRLREEFAAMIAHDLRNPIQSLLVQLALLRATAKAGKPVQEQVLERIERICQRLSRTTSDLLDASRIELSRLPLDLAVTDVVEVVQAVVERVQPTAGDHPMVVRSEPSVPPVAIDAARFEQVLMNLLENAAKYSGAGTTVEVSVKPADGGVDIAVKDQGIGISSEDLPRLFDRFYQAARARQNRTGLGLGLYIAKSLVEAHGGHIGVESVEGRGSTFHVWLPAG